ncbi:MAG: hypothetical protein ACJ796_20565 [Gemmatimonadaceae bacterium]
MKDESKQRLDQDVGLGDDQGTRVGSPTPGAGKKTGAGSEASEGIHSADGDRSESDQTALEGKETGRGTQQGGDQAGSEPIESHGTEHRSKYGGGSRREDGGGQRTP